MIGSSNSLLLDSILTNHQGTKKNYIQLSKEIRFEILQGAVERSPLFGKLINSKPKKIRQLFFFISGKYTEYRFTSTCFEQNITQVAALNIDTLM